MDNAFKRGDDICGVISELDGPGWRCHTDLQLEESLNEFWPVPDEGFNPTAIPEHVAKVSKLFDGVIVAMKTLEDQLPTTEGVIY